MHAFIIQNSNLKPQNSADTLIIESENSIGIDEVRQIVSFLAKKPIQENHNRVYIVNAHLLTIPAQNALLKTLEEPPGDSLIYLITPSPDQLLPTVLSRVEIKPDQNFKEIDGQNLQKIQELLKDLDGKNIGQKLAIVDKLNFTREQALEFLDKLEYFIHQNLNTKINYSAIVQARKYLKANVNVKLVLDQLVLSVV